MGMNTHIKILVIVMGLASVGGCSVDMGSLLRQGPLQETVVGGDEGFFVPYKVAIVDVDGVIVNQREKGLFSSGENPMSLFIVYFMIFAVLYLLKDVILEKLAFSYADTLFTEFSSLIKGE